MQRFHPKQSGFAMLEVLLAVVVIAMASIGVFWLFSSGTTKTQDNQLTNELMAISSAYSSLLGANLTNGVTSQMALVNLLQNSGQVASNYFATNRDDQLVIESPFGELLFTNVSPVGYHVRVDYGSDKTCEQAAALFNSVSNVYDCVSGCQLCETDGSYTSYFILSLDLVS